MKFDVTVVGAGHAGIEAASAAARMGARVCIVTGNLDRIGFMSCNPAIGGIAKGQLVKEIDALGGEMGKAIDETGIQFRRLNRSKGPAVWSTRAQADKSLYAKRMKKFLESNSMFHVKQALVENLILEEKRCVGVVTKMGEEIRSGSTILTTGTFLNGLIHIGTYTEPAGRAGDPPSIELSQTLKKMGFRLGRMKTGTVPRIDKKTVNFNVLEEQWGDDPTPFFSFFTPPNPIKQACCWITHTNKKTHSVIIKNLAKSAMYSGNITGIGPRYCPCIEDKVVRFKDKSQHQIFLEPEGLDTLEIYPNGLSNSLPLHVQVEFLRTIHGLENVEVMRPGYAIEYDYVDPTELFPSLETKKIPSLFHAGQINGTTGYEEAAAQGLMAGINAVLALDRKNPFVLSRAEAYIGVLIDDLVTKGTIEPYRMFTSRAEHRLYLREDNADRRLHPHANRLGLVDLKTNESYELKMKSIEAAHRDIAETRLTPSRETTSKLESLQLPPVRTPITLKEYLRRPEVTWKSLCEMELRLTTFPEGVAEQVEIDVKYEGYITREREEIFRQKKNEDEKIPSAFDFSTVPSLTAEVREKLIKVRPQTLGQAARISGVTPAAVAVLSIFLRKRKLREPSEGASWGE